MVLGDPDDCADRHGLESLRDAEIARQRAAGGAQLGVGHRHLEGGGQHAVHRSAPEELGHACSRGQLTAPGGRGLEQAAYAEIHRRLLHGRQGGIDRRALGEGGTLAPALALLGHDPHEEEGAHPVHAGGGADGVAEREIDLDELDAGQLHGEGAPTPSP